jgi:hypothetical protein
MHDAFWNLNGSTDPHPREIKESPANQLVRRSLAASRGEPQAGAEHLT